MANILDDIQLKLDLILERLSAPTVTTELEPAKKTRAKKADTVAADTPELPGGLVITEADVQQPLAPATPTMPVAPTAPQPVDNTVVLSTIGTQLDMISPSGTPNRELLRSLSLEWLNANGLKSLDLTMGHVQPLVEYCRDGLTARLPQPTGGGL
jgi:hypothetical protein